MSELTVSFHNSLSVVSFMRHLRESNEIGRLIKVVGFDKVLKSLQMKTEFATVRRILSDAADSLLSSGRVVVFPVEKVTMNAEPILIVLGKKVKLSVIFGNRIEQRGPGHFFSPFNIG